MTGYRNIVKTKEDSVRIKIFYAFSLRLEKNYNKAVE